MRKNKGLQKLTIPLSPDLAMGMWYNPIAEIERQSTFQARI